MRQKPCQRYRQARNRLYDRPGAREVCNFLPASGRRTTSRVAKRNRSESRVYVLLESTTGKKSILNLEIAESRTPSSGLGFNTQKPDITAGKTIVDSLVFPGVKEEGRRALSGPEQWRINIPMPWNDRWASEHACPLLSSPAGEKSFTPRTLSGA